nr:hypothetical protein [Angustibacter aerolatus]
MSGSASVCSYYPTCPCPSLAWSAAEHRRPGGADRAACATS